MKAAAQTSNSAIICHSHRKNSTVDSQFRSCRSVCPSHSIHNVLCSDFAISCCLCYECENIKLHIIFFIHFRKAESDGKKDMVRWNKECSPLVDWIDDKVSVSSPISSCVNRISNSTSAWKVWSTSMVRLRSIISNCVLESRVVVRHRS